MKFHLKIWRQQGSDQAGQFHAYDIDGILPEMSFLEMMDQLNEQLLANGETPIEFDSDCREGICGTCGMMIAGMAHGPKRACTTCELRMREFNDGATITVEPFRANAFPVIKDLVIDRSALDRIISAGGYTSVNIGSAPEANAIPVPKPIADEAMDAAACIGCGACIAACPNASAALFTGAKISQLAMLPQGKPERNARAAAMVEQMDYEAFGNCSNFAECQPACPKDISIVNIARMRREYMRSSLTSRR